MGSTRGSARSRSTARWNASNIGSLRALRLADIVVLVCGCASLRAGASSHDESLTMTAHTRAEQSVEILVRNRPSL